MNNSIIPSINDMESAALVLLSSAYALSPYVNVYKGTDEEKKLNGVAQGYNMVAQYLMNKAKERRDLNDPAS